MKFNLLLLGMVLGILLTAAASWGAENEGVENGRQDRVVKDNPAKGGGETNASEDEDGEKYNLNGEEPVTQEDIKGLRSDIETLRDQWQRSLDRTTPQSTRSLKIGGLVQLRYSHAFSDTKSDSFSVNSAILSFGGNLRKDYEQGKNLVYLLSLSTSSDATFKPLDVYLSYSIIGTIDLENPHLDVIAGQQKKPISLESLATEAYKPTIRIAQFSTALQLDERDIGIQIKGDFFPHVDYGYKYRVPAFEYSLAVINGTGPNKLDDNDGKDFVGRVVFNAPVDYSNIFRGLSLGFSGYWGRKKLTMTSGTRSTSQNGDKNRWGADLAYVNTPIGFTLEYIRGEDGSLSGTIANPVQKNIRSEGYTFTLFYNFGEQFVTAFKNQDRYDDWYPLTYQPFFRFDRFTPDLSKRDNRTDIYTVGFNWFFAQTTKLQINYNIKDNAKDTTGKKIHDDELLVQFQYGF